MTETGTPPQTTFKTEIRSNDDSQQVYLVVGCQQFPVGPQYSLQETPNAEWYQKMLDKALMKIATGEARLG